MRTKDLENTRLYENLSLKYFLDRLFVYPVLFLFSPLILIAIWIIKLDGFLDRKNSGSVFYKEPRMSAGKKFNVIKFRTVSTDDLRWIRQKPEERSITWNKKRTSAGQVIVHWYFDEIPQLINIAKGEMSFVGPRPHIVGVYEKEVSEGAFYRKIIKAGLFGIPQACKRSPKHKKVFSCLAENNKASDKTLNTLDGVYARECMNRGALGIIALDFEIIARFFFVFIKGS
jgi:lipopolysaccharide/colanic/teichoic acid biosynthesis glycosyltransferase